MKYKLAIFDLDGTILDTLEDLADSLNAALKKSGYPVRSLEEVRSFVGNGLYNLVERAICPENKEEEIRKVLADLKAHYKVHCADKTKPYEGILPFLKELKDAGYKLAVVSNKADEAVQILCEKYFKGLFHLAVGEKENVRKKPAPDAVNRVLEILDTDRVNAIYIGDSEVDIQTAENAKMKAVLVSWGFREAEFLKKQGAENIVDSVEELRKYLFLD